MDYMMSGYIDMLKRCYGRFGFMVIYEACHGWDHEILGFVMKEFIS